MQNTMVANGEKWALEKNKMKILVKNEKGERKMEEKCIKKTWKMP